MRILAYAMDYWSGGEIKGIFLEHEVKNRTNQSIGLFCFLLDILGLFQCCRLSTRTNCR